LRYEIFIRQFEWPLPGCRDGLEQDEYDTPEAIYLTICNRLGQVVAGVRLLDTAHACLLNDIFPWLVQGSDLPRSHRTYEVTRFAIDHRRDRLEGCPDLRATLLWAIQAAALVLGAEKLVSVSYVHLEPMLGKAGYRFRRLGRAEAIDGVPTVALEHEVSLDILAACQSRVRTPRARESLALGPYGHGEAEAVNPAFMPARPAFAGLGAH
jgi:N-acyl-L-homoserine lactone synthetase